MANGVAEATWLRQLLQELHTPLRRTLVIILVSSSNPVQHQRTRHIEIDIHFVRERVAVGDLLCPPCATSSQYMDIFTKGLLFALHRVQVQSERMWWLMIRLRGRISKCYWASLWAMVHQPAGCVACTVYGS